MRSRHSTRTCYQISLRLRFDATETRACGRERRRCHVKGLIAWPKASSLVGLFPECIVTRTVSIKAYALHRRRGDRATVRGIWHTCTLKSSRRNRVPRDPDQADVDFLTAWQAIKWSCAAATCGSGCPLWVKSRHQRTLRQCPPLYPQKRTWMGTLAMSALCQKRTFRSAIAMSPFWARSCRLFFD